MNDEKDMYGLMSAKEAYSKVYSVRQSKISDDYELAFTRIKKAIDTASSEAKYHTSVLFSVTDFDFLDIGKDGEDGYIANHLRHLGYVVSVNECGNRNNPQYEYIISWERLDD